MGIFESKNIEYNEKLFNDDVNQYKARRIILHEMPQHIDKNGIGCASDKSVHAIIIGTDDLMIAIARQVALNAHYPNYDDRFPEKNRTTITFIIPNAKKNDDLEIFKNQLCANNALCNLVDNCHFTMKIDGNDNEKEEFRQKSFIDVEIELLGVTDNNQISTCLNSLMQRENKLTSIFINKGVADECTMLTLKAKALNVYEIADFQCDNSIDTRRARMINHVYREGGSFNNFVSRDFENIMQYKLSLDTFVFHSTDKIRDELWNKLSCEEKLSNIYCGDMLETRQRSKGNDDYEKTPGLLTKMSKSEHSRWCVDKLISGFRPLTPRESYEYENKLSIDEKNEYKKLLKNKEKAHLNICDFRTLCCIDPVTIKYDCFVILASDKIVKETPI